MRYKKLSIVLICLILSIISFFNYAKDVNALNSYILHIYYNRGTGISDYEIKTIAFPDYDLNAIAIPKYDKHIFSGWYSDQSCENQYKINNNQISESDFLYDSNNYVRKIYNDSSISFTYNDDIEHKLELEATTVGELDMESGLPTFPIIVCGLELNGDVPVLDYENYLIFNLMI